MKAMILAAGKGERMQPLTRHTPKPLLPAGGKALIQYHVEKLAAAACEEIIINHAWLGQQIEAFLGDGSQFGVKIRYSAEGEPLETAGGIIRALPLLGSKPFLIVNGDIWTDYSFSSLLKRNAMQGLAHLVLVANPSHHPQGDYYLEVDSGLVRKDVPVGAEALTYSGMALIDPALFAGMSDGKMALAPVWESYMAKDKVSGECYHGEWFDIGTVERLQALENYLQDKKR